MRKPSTSNTARKNVSSFSLNAEKEIMISSMKKPIRQSKRNEESTSTISTKPIKKLLIKDNGDPILGKRKPAEKVPMPKKRSVLSHLGSNKNSDGPLFS
jgi:hypothetical protein